MNGSGAHDHVETGMLVLFASSYVLGNIHAALTQKSKGNNLKIDKVSLFFVI